ncbi:class I SAM-dependent methyltransferase [Amycolatopsis echigonensis]|uniref:Class I SAM-dependent methyltransferase n=1 Tax=Amycolatopsis echigonensis TaxID=2576905 RepID=A0A2N3WDM6_9PSEU|nr:MULTISPECIES: class I SAM-dependent methyltransferase [Amycolatopsis]MBB2501352.1 class I SAM-dependent methyltransferase [Amycolatopsis echigonensis]PKV91965.1 methyltransferase family protein [Amycolatopsis niigatensis]
MSTLFDADAAGYDEDTFHPYVAEQLISGLPQKPGLLVDVAAGTGAAAFAALRLEPAAVFAIDLSPAMIEIARAKAADRDPSGRITWHVGSAVPLPIGDGEADAVVCASALHFLGPSALTDWRRVLRPGGKLAFSVVSSERFKPGGKFAEVIPRDLRIPGTLDEAAALATDAGFSSAKAQHVTLDQGDRVRQVFAVFAEA